VNLLSVFGLMVLGAMQVASGGCSSSSELYGGGGCESFCTKWVGAHCRTGPTKEDCMNQCQGDQMRCRDATNALLRCATLEAQIACETGSGAPRIVGCAPKQVEQSNCLFCYDTCKLIEGSACSAGPTLEECLAACTGTRCANQYERFAECRPGSPLCTPDGRISYDDSSCVGLFAQLSSCVLPGAPFFVPRPVDDAGADSSDAASDGGFGGLGP
jgi:hypothetical protein